MSGADSFDRGTWLRKQRTGRAQAANSGIQLVDIDVLEHSPQRKLRLRADRIRNLPSFLSRKADFGGPSVIIALHDFIRACKHSERLRSLVVLLVSVAHGQQVLIIL